MKLLRSVLFTFVIFTFAACATNPVTGKKQVILLSEDQEIAMGQEADPQIVATFGLYEDQQMQNFIDRKGQEMAAISHRSHLNYEFKVLDSPVVNAFAVPGGYVYFTRGIMAHFNNEAEFAGVLGHEIGHIAARHSAQQYTNQMLAQIGILAGVIIEPELAQFAELVQSGIGVLFLKFSRDNESESDKLGVEYSTKVGYDAHQMANFFRTIGRLQKDSGADQIPNFLSTHPDPAGRYNSVHDLADEWQQKVSQNNFEINRDNYLKMLEGLVFGEDPRQGFVENSFFYHPDLKFQFPIPSGWETTNSPMQVQIAPSNGKAVMLFMLSQESNLDQAANATVKNNNLQVEESDRTTINNFQAIRMISLVENPQDPSANLRVMTYLIQDGNIYVFHGLSLAKNFNNYHNAFSNTMSGYKRLTDKDKLNRQPDRLRLKKVSKSGSLQQVLSGFGMDGDQLEELAIINGMNLNDQVESGRTIKILGK